MLKIPESELNFHGPNKPYEYFNVINELCERKNWIESPELDGRFISNDPLQYKFISNSFPNHRIPDEWKTSIIVTLEKTGTGTSFRTRTKNSINTWVISIIFIIGVFVFLFSIFQEQQSKMEIVPLMLLYVGYLVYERHLKRRLIAKFKEKVFVLK